MLQRTSKLKPMIETLLGKQISTFKLRQFTKLGRRFFNDDEYKETSAAPGTGVCTVAWDVVEDLFIKAKNDTYRTGLTEIRCFGVPMRAHLRNDREAYYAMRMKEWEAIPYGDARKRRRPSRDDEPKGHAKFDIQVLQAIRSFHIASWIPEYTLMSWMIKHVFNVDITEEAYNVFVASHKEEVSINKKTSLPILATTSSRNYREGYCQPFSVIPVDIDHYDPKSSLHDMPEVPQKAAAIAKAMGQKYYAWFTAPSGRIKVILPTRVGEPRFDLLFDHANADIQSSLDPRGWSQCFMTASFVCSCVMGAMTTDLYDSRAYLSLMGNHNKPMRQVPAPAPVVTPTPVAAQTSPTVVIEHAVETVEPIVETPEPAVLKYSVTRVRELRQLIKLHINGYTGKYKSIINKLKRTNLKDLRTELWARLANSTENTCEAAASRHSAKNGYTRWSDRADLLPLSMRQTAVMTEDRSADVVKQLHDLAKEYLSRVTGNVTSKGFSHEGLFYMALLCEKALTKQEICNWDYMIYPLAYQFGAEKYTPKNFKQRISGCLFEMHKSKAGLVMVKVVSLGDQKKALVYRLDSGDSMLRQFLLESYKIIFGEDFVETTRSKTGQVLASSVGNAHATRRAISHRFHGAATFSEILNIFMKTFTVSLTSTYIKKQASELLACVNCDRRKKNLTQFTNSQAQTAVNDYLNGLSHARSV